MQRFRQALLCMKVVKKMNEWIWIGKIVNTHGIKGELRILSDFDQKEKVFHSGFSIYIGNEKREEKINTYRKHKNFDMVCYEGISNINEVLMDKGKPIYVRRSDLNLKEDEYLLEDLISCEIIENGKLVGKVMDVVYNKGGILLEVITETKKKFYIPKNQEFIKEIKIKERKIDVQHIQGLMI